MKTGIELIAEERQRQISTEGWTPEHDDRHTDGALAFAAATYALPEEMRNSLAVGGCSFKERLWPFDDFWFKPKTPIQDLIRAGALIAAEIDRLQRSN